MWEVDGNTLKHTIAYKNRRKKIRLSLVSFHTVQYCLYYKRVEENLLTKRVEEEGADKDEGETEADEEGDHAGDEERRASVLLKYKY